MLATGQRGSQADRRAEASPGDELTGLDARPIEQSFPQVPFLISALLFATAESFQRRITFGCAVAASIRCRWAAARYRKIRQSAVAHLLH